MAKKKAAKVEKIDNTECPECGHWVDIFPGDVKSECIDCPECGESCVNPAWEGMSGNKKESKHDAE